MMHVDAHTRLVALLGYPVEHSRSPLLHNMAFRHQGLNHLYVACQVPPREVAAAVAGLQALHFLGANVTIPHKQAVLPLVDACSPQARAVGAVNTIVCRRPEDGAASLWGDNTDVAGFLAGLAPYAEALAGAPMAVLGAGGAARAVVYALLSTFRPSRLTLVARRTSQAEALAQALSAYDQRKGLAVAPFEAAHTAVRTSRLVVNTTPVGMHPAVEATPWPQAEDFSPGQIVYDLVYNPEQTRLLREARHRGARVVGGLVMLIEQAAAAYIQWTGQPMPVEVVTAALRGDRKAGGRLSQ